MGLKCSFLGHAFEPAGVERDREEQGSEVVTVVRELEACTRCGQERVVSESTEVTAVVEPDDVDAEVDDSAGGPADERASGHADERASGHADERASGHADERASGHADNPAERADGSAGGAAEDRAGGQADNAAERAEGATGGLGGAVDRAVDEGETADEPAGPADPDEEPAAARADDTDPAEEELGPRDPAEEDAEILTDDDEPERQPGEWPDDPEEDEGEDEEEPPVDLETEDPGEESLSGITVPEGRIVCPECGFEVDAESSYRDGDPCPECGTWLTTESA